MTITEFQKRVYKRTGKGSRVGFDGERFFINVTDYYLPIDITPKTEEELEIALQETLSVLDQKLTKSDTDLILVRKDGSEALIKENISQYDKLKREKEAIEKAKINNALHWEFWRDINSGGWSGGSISSLGIFHRKDDPNFYYKEREYDPHLQSI